MSVRPSIVFVHGTRFARGQWCSQLGPLSAEFPVAAVDLPGHGSRSAEPWDLDRAADLVARPAAVRWYPPEVVGATIADGYAFHTLPVAWRDVMGRFDASSLAAVPAPVLILNGERDRLFRSGERTFARARPGTRIEHVPRAGHLANFDAPAAVTDAIRRFARELSPAS